MSKKSSFILSLLFATSQLSGVTPEQLNTAGKDGKEWLTHGRDYAETRYSPLSQITKANVGQLGLAWYADMTKSTGLEATPLIADGVLYTTGHWNVVHAFDARTGKELWQYDPRTDREASIDLCCSVANRGVALWGDKLYFGTVDGRLIALDRASGRLVWEVPTADRTKGYSITGAPRIIKGMVIIGNGGADMRPVRGYVTAYDAQTGQQRWRFFTVPGNPNEPFENAAMEMASKTWHGEWWKLGGGGTVWDSMAYDAELDLLYIGVGNGTPWNQQFRSEGKGDNLFVSSIVALRPETGDYVWHYQTTPGETWDYTASQHIILTDLTINGKLRKVLMQAPKNGFFYVLDRQTGELLSAKNYVEQSWTTGIDMATGRPIEVPGARFKGHAAFVTPSPLGGHNWQSMAYHPGTGLVYIPIREFGAVYESSEGAFKFRPDLFNTGLKTLGMNELPPKDLFRFMSPGFLIAWDPVAQKEVWRAPGNLWDGGVLTTGGGLVFQGNSGSEFAAYDAAKGEKLWSFDTQSGPIAAPVTYELDGTQYVALMSGWGGAIGTVLGGIYPEAIGPNRLLVFRLGGEQVLPPKPRHPSISKPPQVTGTPEVISKGEMLYNTYCGRCHGAAVIGGVISDLRYSAPAVFDNYTKIVTEGGFLHRGMPNFSRSLTPEDAEAIKQFVLYRANADYSAGREDAN